MNVWDWLKVMGIFLFLISILFVLLSMMFNSTFALFAIISVFFIVMIGRLTETIL